MINIGYFVWLVGSYADDFEAAPLGQMLVLNHLMFVGVMTNAIFALMSVACSARRELWSWADNVIPVGVNVGLAGFVAGLLADEAVLKQISTPIMGGAILLGIAVFTARLQTRAAAAVAEAPAS